MGKKNYRFSRFNPFKDRTPVHRKRSAEFLLITLISFAASVGGTRLFLELTGYPQLGNSVFHIAHVLWGGLLLFAAVLLPLIYVNEWALTISAVVAGLGIGLFIDEVGKFITQNNDYFHPSAAPIIYVFFLLTVLLFVLIQKRSRKSERAKMYGILEQFTEVLDRDLSEEEFEELLSELNNVISKSESKGMTDLAINLRGYLVSNKARIVPDDPTFYERIRLGFINFEKKWLEQKRYRMILIIGLLAWGAWALISPIGFLSISRNAAQLQVFLEQLINNRLVSNPSGLTWFEIRVLFEGSMGLVSIIAAILLIAKADDKGLWIGIIDLLVTLTIVNPLIFYFEQFSTITLAIFQFILFILLIRYRKRFFAKPQMVIKKES